MDEISLHIDFLLHKHDCVIVPNLGGFVVNISDIERNGLWGLDAPSCELIFNSKLTYNDGLLAESLMKTKTISYDTAIEIINSACKELKDKLIKGEQVKWNNLGAFKGINKDTENNRVLFSPSKFFIRPQYYGLTNARLNPATLFTSENNKKDNLIPLKPFIQYISSAVAIGLLLFFIVVSYNNFDSKNQQADMVSKSLIFNKNNFVASAKKESTKNDANKITHQTAGTNNIDSTPNINTSSSQLKSASNYYIIVGVYEVKDVAEKTLGALQNQGFNSASLLRRSGRLDVYSASFTDKQEAQTFLKKFKSENPRYRDAWLLKY